MSVISVTPIIIPILNNPLLSHPIGNNKQNQTESEGRCPFWFWHFRPADCLLVPKPVQYLSPYDLFVGHKIFNEIIPVSFPDHTNGLLRIVVVVESR